VVLGVDSSEQTHECEKHHEDNCAVDSACDEESDNPAAQDNGESLKPCFWRPPRASAWSIHGLIPLNDRASSISHQSGRSSSILLARCREIGP
jgi:hypothetical protein